MRNLKRLLAVALIATCCASAGCTLGPIVKNNYVLVYPGKPLTVLDSTTVKGRYLDGTGNATEQNIGGWVAMPPEHWEAVQRALAKQEPEK